MSDNESGDWIKKAYVKNPIFISELIKRWEGSYIDGVELTPNVILELVQNNEIYVWRYDHMGFMTGKKQFVGYPEPVPDDAAIEEIADKYFACMDNIDAFEVNNRISRAPGVGDAERAFAYTQLAAYEQQLNELRQRAVRIERRNALLEDALKRTNRELPKEEDRELTGKELGSYNRLILIMGEALRAGDRVEIGAYGTPVQLENIGRAIEIELSNDTIAKMIKRALQYQNAMQK